MTQQKSGLVWLVITWRVLLALVTVGVGLLLSAVLYGDADLVGHRLTLAVTAVLATTAELTSARTLAWVLSRRRR